MMSEVYYDYFDVEKSEVLYCEVNEMRVGDVLNLRNRDFGDRSIMLFADSLLARNLKGKFLVSRRGFGDDVYGITVGRTAA